MRKKALIITYYWPPAGGPGVQRWLKFVKYLPEFDVEPIIFIPENPSYPLIDNTLTDEVSEALTILKLPIKEPYKFAGLISSSSTKTISKGIIKDQKKQSILEKVMLYVRGNFFIPDARVSWVKPSVAYLTKHIEDEGIDVIITTGPPHSLHLIGLKLNAKLNMKWIADFRDPWTTIGYHKRLKLSKRSRLKHKALEFEVLNTADQIIVTSAVTKQEFSKITSKPIEVITNGYDNLGIEDVILDSMFTMSHIGSLLSERNPIVLWKVLKDLIHENPNFEDAFQLNLVGTVSQDVLEAIKEYGLSKYTSKVGYISYKESVIFQKKTQVLLLVEIDSEDTKCIIPGKLFDYMVSNRPIIAIGPKGSDVEVILEDTTTGSYFYYDAYDSIKQQILMYFEFYQNKSLKSNATNLEKYSRRALTKQLSKLI